MAETREELATKIDVADWHTLRAHLERGGIIVVDRRLEMADAGLAVATDDVPAVEGWILEGLMGKPTAAQVEEWDKDKGKSFLCLIVSPYVLIQESARQG